MLQSYCFLARFVFPGNAFVSRRVHPYLRCHFFISFFWLGSILKQRRQQQRIEDHNLFSARKLFFKNLASVISYLSSDSLRYSNLFENFKTKPQDSIQCNRW